MDELLENLNTILQEKEEKILPENIKKDVEIFGVTGTLGDENNNEESEYNALLECPLNRTTFTISLWITEIKEVDMAGVTSMSSAFANFRVLKKISKILNTAAVTNFYRAFYDCKELEEIPFLDTSSATSMSGIYSGCSKITEAPD